MSSRTCKYLAGSAKFAALGLGVRTTLAENGTGFRRKAWDVTRLCRCFGVLLGFVVVVQVMHSATRWHGSVV